MHARHRLRKGLTAGFTQDCGPQLNGERFGYSSYNISHYNMCGEEIEYNTILDSKQVLTILDRRRDST
jgi:hypothetical protein